MSFRDNFIALESRSYRRVLVAERNEFFLLRIVKGSRLECFFARGDRSLTQGLLKTHQPFPEKSFRSSRVKMRKSICGDSPYGVVSPRGPMS